MQIERLQLHPNVVNCYTTYLHPSSALALANKYRIINMGGMKYIGALTHLVSGLSYNLNMSANVKVIGILESSPNWSANLPNSFNPDLRVSDRKIGNQLESPLSETSPSVSCFYWPTNLWRYDPINHNQYYVFWTSRILWCWDLPCLKLTWQK